MHTKLIFYKFFFPNQDENLNINFMWPCEKGKIIGKLKKKIKSR